MRRPHQEYARPVLASLIVILVALEPANPEVPTVKNIIATIDKMKK
jgi:hypothetical protein